MYYNQCILVYAIVLLFMGFVLTSRGAKITEKLKTVVVILAHGMLVALLINAIIDKSLILAAVTVLFYFILPGAGRTITLMIMGRARQIGGISWAWTILSLAVLVHVLIYGRLF